MSQGEPQAVADTVVLRYFLLADAFDLLVQLLGPAIAVTRVVYDPDEGGADPHMRSEMTRSIAEQRARAIDPHRSDEERTQATQRAERLAAVTTCHERGAIVTVDMNASELRLYAQSTDQDQASGIGLLFALGDGQAASLAIAVNRRWTLATDDNDALKALRKIRRGHPYQRIRKLLISAADRDLIGPERANSLHATMREAGFWDKQPFPAP